jgi:hypothetical protein
MIGESIVGLTNHRYALLYVVGVCCARTAILRFS